MERTVPSLRLEAMLVAAYLGAIVAANLAVARFGPAALPVSAFLLIPFDLCARDMLHERWQGRALFVKMLALICAGSLVSYALSASASRVALASVLAFSAAATIDAIVYHLGRRLLRLIKMNLSNACAALTDSIVFPVVAFGSTTFVLSATQTAAKCCGGILWSFFFVSYIESRRRRVRRS